MDSKMALDVPGTHPAASALAATPARRTHAAVALAAALLLALACMLGLSGCGGGQQEELQDPTEIVNTDQQTTSTEEQAAGTDDSTASGEDEASAGAQEDKKDASTTTAGSLAGTIVCIDAGHGSNLSTDPSPNNPDSDVSENINTQPLGASGDESGNEYDVNLAVAKYLQADLEAAGATVVMVRTTNDVVISPKERAEIANDAGADIFIRLHCDSAGSSTRGFLTLIPGDTGYQADDDLYKTSQAMGKFMHERIVEELGANDRGTDVRTDQGGFNWCKVPCVLFEMGNMDNAKDDALLADDSYLQKMATAICNATVSYVTG